MFRFIRLRLAERRLDRLTGELIAYSRAPLGQWHAAVHTAKRIARDKAAAAYAALLVE